MKSNTQHTGRNMGIFIFLFSLRAMVFSQNIVITDSASFSGGGTINVKGDIIDSATTNKTITGNTRLLGTSAQNIGIGATGGIGLTFDSLKVDSASVKTMHVPVTVSKHLALNAGNLVVNNKTLNIDSASTKSNGILTADSAADIVQYRGSSGSQTIIDATYSTLNLQNSVPINMRDSVSASILKHTGTGALTVNKKMTVNTSASIKTLANVTDSLIVKGASDSIGTILASSGVVSKAGAGSLRILTVAGNNGTIATNSGALAIDTLNANAGIIKTQGVGGVSFTANAVNSGTITDSTGTGGITFNASLNNNAGGRVTAGNGGSLAFNSSITNGGTVAVNGNGTSNFATGVNNSGGTLALVAGSATFNANFINPGTLSFDSTSHVLYSGTTDSVETATYGNLVLSGTNNKGAKGNLGITDSLILGSKKLTLAGSNSLTLSSWKGNNVVNDTAGEVIGKVTRTNDLFANTYYAFNKDSVGFALDSTVTSHDLAINMIPGDSFKTPSPNQKYVKRYFGFTGTVGTAKLKTLALAYAQPEVMPSAIEAKLGVRSDLSSNWQKVNNSAGYTRTVDSVNNIVLLQNLASPLAGVSEFGIINTAYQTIADNRSWTQASPSVWDEGSAPSTTDDAEIDNTGITIGAAGASAASLVINNGKSLVVDNALNIASSLDNFGSLSVNAPDTLTLASLNHNSSTALNNAGTITMSGKFRVHGPVNNTGVINVGQ
ncbi:MAG: beta strand repeat-containing protein [Bacteroidota bacterium]